MSDTAQRASVDVAELIPLKVQLPTIAGYITKKFPKNATVREVIEKLNETLPENARSPRYRLHVNGLRLLDETRTIGSHGVKFLVRSCVPYYNIILCRVFLPNGARRIGQSLIVEICEGFGGVEARHGV